MNEADHAEKISSVFLEASIKNARSAGRALLPRGNCYFCEETVEKPKLFCDSTCAKDYERLMFNRRK